MKRSSATLLTIFLLIPALLLAADVGKRDIFRVGDAEFLSETEFTVPLGVIHDEDLAAMDLPLTFSKGVTLDKVTFEGTRVDNFDVKLVNIDNEKNQVIIGLINMVYSLKEEMSLKPATNGNYVVAVLHFTLDDPSLETVEIGHFTTNAPGHSLTYVYNDWSQDFPMVASLHPEFEGGLVALNSRTPNLALPMEFGLSQNVPNPFNPTTQISFALPNDSKVTLTIFNVLGQKVTTLVDDFMTAGYQTVTWDGTGTTGQSVASGVYFYKLNADNYSATKKMLLLK